MTRNGKIARLPRPLREEINRRLQNGTTGRALVAWLNDRPDVREVMAQHFGGSPLNEQNLTEWRQGGYTEWLAHQEFLDRLSDVAGDAADLEAVGGAVADHAARLLAARFALALSEWDGDPDHPAMAKLRACQRISHELIALRRGDHSAARLRMEQERFDQQRSENKQLDEAETRRLWDAEFMKFLHRPDIRRLLENGVLSGDDRLRIISEKMWGSLDGAAPQDVRRLTAANRAINGDGI